MHCSTEFSLATEGKVRRGLSTTRLFDTGTALAKVLGISRQLLHQVLRRDRGLKSLWEENIAHVMNNKLDSEVLKLNTILLSPLSQIVDGVLLEEVWATSLTYRNKLVSSFGRVLTVTHYRKGGFSYTKYKEMTPYEMANTAKTKDNPWRAVTLGKRQVYLHRLVAEVFVPNEQGLNTVRHLDGNKANNTTGNLVWIRHKGKLKEQ